MSSISGNNGSNPHINANLATENISNNQAKAGSMGDEALSHVRNSEMTQTEGKKVDNSHITGKFLNQMAKLNKHGGHVATWSGRLRGGIEAFGSRYMRGLRVIGGAIKKAFSPIKNSDTNRVNKGGDPFVSRDQKVELQPTPSYDLIKSSLFDGLVGFSQDTKATQKKVGYEDVKPALTKFMDKNFKGVAESELPNLEPSVKGQAWVGTEIKRDLVVKGTKIKKSILQKQIQETKIRVIEGKVDGGYVKNAAKIGLEQNEKFEVRQEKMLWRCVSSPITIFLGANMNKLDKPSTVQAYVMSARDYTPRSEEGYKPSPFETKTAGKEILDQSEFYFGSAIEDGCDVIVDSGFGMGIFLGYMSETEKAACFETFAKSWVEAAVGKMENGKPFFVMADGGRLGEKVRNEINNLPPDQQKQFLVTNKMITDVAIKLEQEGFKPAIRIAGDKAGRAGMLATRSDGKDFDVAQEEMIGVTSTLTLMNQAMADAKVINVKKP